MAQPHTAQRITRSACNSVPGSFSFSLNSNRAASANLHSSNPHSSVSSHSTKKKKRQNYPFKKNIRSTSEMQGSSKSSPTYKTHNLKQVQPVVQEKPKESQFQKNKQRETIKEEKRVAANSSVNFAHLTDQEQVLRYKNMLQEYNELNKQVKRMEDEADERYEPPILRPERTKDEKSLVMAQKKLKQGVFEIPDSTDLMENMATLLAQKKLRSDSLEFGMVSSLVRKVMKKLKKGDKNLVGKTERRYFKVASKEGLIEFFTGIRLDQDEELRSSVLGHEGKTKVQQPAQPKEKASIAKSSEVDIYSIQSSYQFPVESHMNAEPKLNAAMLRQFNRDHHPLPYNWR